MDLLGFIIAGIATVIAAMIAIKITLNVRAARKERAAARSWLQPFKATVAEIRALYPQAKDILETLRPELSQYRWYEIEHRILSSACPSYKAWEESIERYERAIHRRELYDLQRNIDRSYGHAFTVLTRLSESLSLPTRFREARTNAPKLFGTTAVRITALRETVNHADVSYDVKRRFAEQTEFYIQVEGRLQDEPSNVDWIEVAASLKGVNDWLDSVEKKAQSDIHEVAEAKKKIAEDLDTIPELLEKGEETVRASPHPSQRAEKLLSEARGKFNEAKAKNGGSRDSTLETLKLLNSALGLINAASESDKRHREFIASRT